MSEWQPIETAPKDGTRILAYDPKYWANGSRQWEIIIIRWDGYDETWGWYQLDGDDPHPTLWMPLPEPPK